MSELIVKIIANDHGNPPGKLADAELHFLAGPLAGCKLTGFAVWERRGGHVRNVTFPARSYSINGERRSFALLRPITDPEATLSIRDLILEAYAEYEATPEQAECASCNHVLTAVDRTVGYCGGCQSVLPEESLKAVR